MAAKQGDEALGLWRLTQAGPCSCNSQQASVPGHVTFRDVASDFSLSKGSGRKREGKWMRINEKTLKTEVTVF